jgi:hypothetical protein
MEGKASGDSSKEAVNANGRDQVRHRQGVVAPPLKNLNGLRANEKFGQILAGIERWLPVKPNSFIKLIRR